ncbi:hypothetical protein SANTM175S_00559 [Streptomyces antimycoticus]
MDGGLVEAVQAMGGSTWTVVRKVLLPESLPALISSATTTIVALIGYSAMAGTVGAGGLGDLAVRYGYLRVRDQADVDHRRHPRGGHRHHPVRRATSPPAACRTAAAPRPPRG